MLPPFFNFNSSLLAFEVCNHMRPREVKQVEHFCAKSNFLVTVPTVLARSCEARHACLISPRLFGSHSHCWPEPLDEPTGAVASGLVASSFLRASF